MSAIGLELAQTFRRLGAEVTVIEAATLMRALVHEGVTLRMGAQINPVTLTALGASRFAKAVRGIT